MQPFFMYNNCIIITQKRGLVMKRRKKYQKRFAAKIGEERAAKINNAWGVARVIKNIICWSLIVVLAFCFITFLLARVNGKTPTVFGYSIQRVTSGSMEPALHVQDVILSKKVSDKDDLKVGDIITFQGGSRFDNNRVTHRIIVEPFKDDEGDWVVVTMGDANEIDDGPIKLQDIESKMVCKLDVLRWLYSFFFSPWGLIVFILLMILIFFDEVMNIIHIVTGKYEDEEDPESIGEIIKRIQREDAEKLAKERHDRARLEDYGEDSFDQIAEPDDFEDPDPDFVDDEED